MTLNSAPKNVNADYWCNLAIRLTEGIELQLSEPLRLTSPSREYFRFLHSILHKQNPVCIRPSAKWTSKAPWRRRWP